MDDWKSLTLRDLEKQLSPNIWNPSKDKIKIIDTHFQLTTKGSDKAKQLLTTQLNVPYGPKDTQKFDVYGTNLPENAPVFFWVHGGGWHIGSKDFSSFFAPRIIQRGIKFIATGYSLAPEVKVNDIQMDVRESLKLAMTMFKQARFILGGHSAGAHLTASLLHTSPIELPAEFCQRILGMFLVSGLYDMRVFIPTYVNIALQMTPEETEELSPLLQQYINPNFLRNDLRIEVCVGKYESPLFHFQSQAYNKHLMENKLCSRYSFLRNDDHFSILEDFAQKDSEIGLMLHEFLRQCTGVVQCSKL